MKEFNQILLGTANGAQFFAWMFFAVITALALILFRVRKRDPASPRTPENFSWKFYWADNIKQNIGTIILIFLSLRVAQYKIAGEWMVPTSIIIGLISDQLAMLALKLKDKSTQFFSKQIDKVGHKVDDVKSDVDDVKSDVAAIKEKTDQL
jgi:hypothetical protein